MDMLASGGGRGPPASGDRRNVECHSVKISSQPPVRHGIRRPRAGAAACGDEISCRLPDPLISSLTRRSLDADETPGCQTPACTLRYVTFSGLGIESTSNAEQPGWLFLLARLTLITVPTHGPVETFGVG